MEDIENECEDAVFEICELREQYPARCIHILSKSLKLKSEINTTNIKADSIHINEIEIPLKQEDEKVAIFENFESSLSKENAKSKKNSRQMLENINNLIIVGQQLKSEEFCELEQHLKRLAKMKSVKNE